MNYFLIAGEASGDLHGSNLMAALKKEDKEAQFCFFGGDLMQAEGGVLLKHYRDMAFMGFIPVLLHLPTILRNMKVCQSEIVNYQPDVVILIDYPGFNLKIAKFVKIYTKIPVYYYISPKVWAWKKYRVKSFKKYVDEMFCILPFEVDFFKKHNYRVNYVGNPTVDSVSNYRIENDTDSFGKLIEDNKLSDKPIIALLAGSRKQEIESNLPDMLEAVKQFSDYQAVIAAAPSIDSSFYSKYTDKSDCKIIFDQTYRLLSYAKAALVTSGTATLETSLFRCPQVVCYKVAFPLISSWAFKHILTTKYISLVNLVANKRVVQELFANQFSVKNIQRELAKILHDQQYRTNMLANYNAIVATLGEAGASGHTAHLMIDKLNKRNAL